ncbi:hypothetical protein, partial [Aeromicrobium sp. CnD17-E]|uniref:hypothetical protein n=1 Tax=Aeromicrobium sp. CnD17-E TaxID=2954487 RepID=UPI002098123A
DPMDDVTIEDLTEAEHQWLGALQGGLLQMGVKDAATLCAGFLEAREAWWALPAAERSGALAPRVVEGRVVVPPTQDQVVAATLSRPQVRLAVVAEGLAHALRPESRDRISALVRREYRGRRRERLRAGRRAARAAHASALPTAPADQWLGER